MEAEDAFSAALERARSALGRSNGWHWAYAAYALIHLVVSPFFIVRSLVRDQKRTYRGLVLKRLLGGTRPPRRARWTVLVAGGLGEQRTGFSLAESLEAHGWKDIAVCAQRVDALAAGHPRLTRGVVPFNNPFSALAFLLRWRPTAMVAIEAYSNYHLFSLARLMGIRTLVVNAAPKESEIAKGLRSPLRFQLAQIYASQSQEHAARLILAGLPSDRVLVVGPLSALFAASPPSEEVRAALRQAMREGLGLTVGDFPVIVAGSTYPADETVLLEAFALLRDRFPEAVLVLAPRHLGRPGGPDAVLREAGLEFTRRSENPGTLSSSRIVLLDTLGELKDAYAAADIAFVGGSMDPTLTGHTPVEACAFGLPITVGPYFPHQQALMDILIDAGIAHICDTPDALAGAWIRYAEDPAERSAVATGTAAAFAGIESRWLALAHALLPGAPQHRA